ncbi:MAG: hypothetical protein KIT33_03405 [Candidatus Kapabacteria bacterium]|nr:hypothetical protein [Ignavibacteriota bacterium]MCW5883998.1 hypothetical protein [Candidatus Kapabacteria bacterium]
MKINSVNTLANIYGLKNETESRKAAVDNKASSSSERINKSDKLEISDDIKKIRLIKSRLEDGTYNNRDIDLEIASRILEYAEI